MIIAMLSLVFGLLLLLWSSDKFIEGSIGLAHSYGISALLIGIVIVGFGTSVPELLVSALAAVQGNPSLALGNAYGSNIANIGLILGVSSLLKPIAVQSRILRNELPVLLFLSVIALLQLLDGILSLYDALVLLALFVAVISWNVWQGRSKPEDHLGQEVKEQLLAGKSKRLTNLMWLLAGLVLLLVSSRMIVSGAVTIAQYLGVSDLVIGLTVVAIGTSLPELASSLMAVRKQAHDIALGNIIGSNTFNVLMVVGLSGTIHPFEVPTGVLRRDIPVMLVLTFLLLLFGRGVKGEGRINRIEGGVLLCCYLSYLGWLIFLE